MIYAVNIVVSMVLLLALCMFFCQVLEVVTVALYITLCVLQLPCTGNCVLFRQLHGILVCVLSGCFMMRFL